MAERSFTREVEKLRRVRRSTHRYKQQRVFMNDWLDCITATAVDDYEYGLSVARCVEIVKGYGDTYARGLNRYLAIGNAGSGAGNGAAVERLHQAALADEKGVFFKETLASLEGTG